MPYVLLRFENLELACNLLEARKLRLRPPFDVLSPENPKYYISRAKAQGHDPGEAKSTYQLPSLTQRSLRQGH